MRAIKILHPRMPVSLVGPILRQLAVWHRRRLDRTTFIGVVGSAGKTTTKRMTAAVLSSRYRGSARRGTANYAHSISESVLMARRADGFCVVELSAGTGPDSLCKPLDLLKPTIGVVTCIGTDHYSSFGSQDAIALEKGRLIRELPETGVAVLNADDPRVIAMRTGCRARVISFGLTADADVRAEAVRATWPDRLSFELVHKGDRLPVQTQLCGTQSIGSALAAAAVGIAMDIPLTDIVRSLGTVEPFMARMSPLELPDGVTFIRDDWKASMHTIAPALEFLRAARAARKIAVIGTISDYSGSSRTQYARTARYALEVADLVVFVGPRSFGALRARPQHQPERLRAFSTVEAATSFLAAFLKSGDLVLLKGSNPADHLYRIALSRTSTVLCWREDCGKGIFCDACSLVGKVYKKPGRDGAGPRSLPESTALVDSLAAGRNILVGLGNPGDKYANTPHNVGYAVVDRIATECGASWTEIAGALVALVEWRRLSLCLVKPKVVMNLSGNVLHELSEQSGIEPEQVVLVYDDIDLPLGKVRGRLRGTDGGHCGVRSILNAFQTDEFRRIKVGVRRAAESHSAREAVLRSFSETEAPLISAAIEEACSRLQEMVRSGDRDVSTAS